MMCGCGNHSRKQMDGNGMHEGMNSNEDAGITSGSALAILNERYVRGELSRDEYLKMRADIIPADRA